MKTQVFFIKFILGHISSFFLLCQGFVIFLPKNLNLRSYGQLLSLFITYLGRTGLGVGLGLVGGLGGPTGLTIGLGPGGPGAGGAGVGRGRDVIGRGRDVIGRGGGVGRVGAGVGRGRDVIGRGGGVGRVGAGVGRGLSNIYVFLF